MKKMRIEPNQYGCLKVFALNNLHAEEYAEHEQMNKTAYADLMNDYARWSDPESDYAKDEDWLNATSFTKRESTGGIELHLRVAFKEYGDGKRFTVFYWSDDDSRKHIYSYHHVEILRVYDGDLKMDTGEFVSLCEDYANYKISEFVAKLKTQLTLLESMDAIQFRWDNNIFDSVYAPF
jgi:hypothetical protein